MSKNKSKSKSKPRVYKLNQTQRKAALTSYNKGATTLDKLQAALKSKGKGYKASRQSISNWLQSTKKGKRAAPGGWIAQAKAYQKETGKTWKASSKHILSGRGFTERRAKRARKGKISIDLRKSREARITPMWQLCVIMDMKDEKTGEIREGMEGYSYAHASKNFTKAYEEAVRYAQAAAGGSNWYVTRIVSTSWNHFV
jgi:hypothetical protein